MKTKTLVIEQMDDAGKGLARIGTMSAIDNDGDTYRKGAFSWTPEGHQWAQIVPAHDWSAMPFGKARVYESEDTIYAELHLNLETQAGREWHAALKFDLATGNPIQEWSYGYDTLNAEYEMRGASRVRALMKLQVHEVSPVLKGAGIGTGTVSIKGAALKPGQFGDLIAGLQDMTIALDSKPEMLSATGIKQLGDVQASLSKAIIAATKSANNDTALDTLSDVATDTIVADHLRHLARRHLR